ncbi:MAG TPA: hypothetical protein VFH56_14370 [Acidimicrobiales bacterium]|nr:hypothetical protein [Acidimicrobiales bacterium]
MAKYRKFYLAAVAAVGVIVASGLLTGKVEMIVNTIIAAVGAASVYVFPNATDTPTPPAPAAPAKTEAGEVLLPWSLVIAVVLLLAFLFGWGVLH